MPLGLIVAIAAVVIAVLGLVGVVGKVVLAVSLLVVGLVLLATDRGWFARR